MGCACALKKKKKLEYATRRKRKTKKTKKKKHLTFFFLHASLFRAAHPFFFIHFLLPPPFPTSSIDFHFSTLSHSTLSLFTLCSLPTSQPLSPYLYSLLCRRRRSATLSLSLPPMSRIRYQYVNLCLFVNL